MTSPNHYMWAIKVIAHYANRGKFVVKLRNGRPTARLASSANLESQRYQSQLVGIYDPTGVTRTELADDIDYAHAEWVKADSKMVTPGRPSYPESDL